MKLELERYLVRTLARFLSEQGERVAAAESQLGDFARLLQPPAHVGADYCSAILVRCAASAETRGVISKDNTIAQFAEAFCRYCQTHAPWSGLTFSASGSGHVNLKLSTEFKQNFIRELLLAPDRFLSFESLLLQEETFDKPKLKLRFASNELQVFSDSTRAFLAARTPVTKDDILMALYLELEPELDEALYVSGVKGKENRPWYIRRAAYDSGGFVKDLKRFTRASEFNQGLRALSVLWSELMELRAQLVRSERDENPLPLAQAARLIADGFYRFYNDPHCRYPQAEVDGRALLLSSQLVQRTLLQLLEELEFCCEPAPDVLEKIIGKL